MVDYDALRIVMEQKATAFVTISGVKCRFDDEPFVPPTDGAIYSQFWFKTGKTRLLELGPATGYECTPGILQYTIYAPEKSGAGEPGRLAGAFKKAFNRKQWLVAPDGHVTIEPVSVQDFGVRNGHRIFVADAGFDFHHRDPDAI